MGNKFPSPTYILGVKVDRWEKNQLITMLRSAIKNKKKLLIGTPNAEITLKANENKDFKEILNSVDIAIADGFGLIVAAYIYKLKKILGWKTKYQTRLIPEQISGDVLFRDLIKLSAEENWRVFLLGGGPNVAKSATTKIKNLYSNLNIAYDCGPPEVNNFSKKNNQKLVRKINLFKPNFLFVAFGAPKQETWLVNNWSKISANVGMGIGGTLDDFIGITRPTPNWIRKLKLRSLWRLVTQPSRYLRVMNALVVFPWKVLWSKD